MSWFHNFQLYLSYLFFWESISDHCCINSMYLSLWYLLLNLFLFLYFPNSHLHYSECRPIGISAIVLVEPSASMVFFPILIYIYKHFFPHRCMYETYRATPKIYQIIRKSWRQPHLILIFQEHNQIIICLGLFLT